MKVYIDETGNYDPKDHVECLGFAGLILPNYEEPILAASYVKFKNNNKIQGEFKLNAPDPKRKDHKELVKDFKKWLHSWIKSLKRHRTDKQIFTEVMIMIELEDKSNLTEYEKSFSSRLNLVKNDYKDLYEGKGNDYSTVYNASLLSVMVKCMQKYKMLKTENLSESKLEFIIDECGFNQEFLKKPLSKYYTNFRNKLEKYYSTYEKCNNILPLDIQIVFDNEVNYPILEVIHNIIVLCKWEKEKLRKKAITPLDRFVTGYKYLILRDDNFTGKIFEKIERDVAV